MNSQKDSNDKKDPNETKDQKDKKDKKDAYQAQKYPNAARWVQVTVEGTTIALCLSIDRETAKRQYAQYANEYSHSYDESEWSGWSEVTDGSKPTKKETATEYLKKAHDKVADGALKLAEYVNTPKAQAGTGPNAGKSTGAAPGAVNAQQGKPTSAPGGEQGAAESAAGAGSRRLSCSIVVSAKNFPSHLFVCL